MIQITIDGQKIEAPEGTTLLRAAEAAGIQIPKLCDYDYLKPYGGCRLCVVEVEGARTLQPSCTLPIYNGMVVYTNTPKVREARRFVLTLLFSERNHFCMYCQVSGGDCDLQNAALNEGMTHWPLQPNWEPYPVDATHPYFVLDHNRCILCRRCVRACGDLVGNFTLGAEDRGAKTMIVADYDLPLGESSCIRCGTCVSVCPTGALIDRQSAYRGKAAETDKFESICIGCSVGCGIEVLVRDNQIVRLNANWESPVNGGLLCEDGRYKPMYDERQRILTPLVRKNGALKAATWEEALDVVSSKLGSLRGKNGAGVAALTSTRLPAEALALFKTIFADGMGSTMVADYEERFTTSPHSSAQATMDDLRKADCVLVVGADLFKRHQVAGFMVKRNLPLGMQMIVLDTNENKMDAQATVVLKPAKGADKDVLAALAELVSGANSKAGATETGGVLAENLERAAQMLAGAKSPVIVYGKGVTGNGGAETQRLLETLKEISKLTNAKLFSPRGQANSLAAQAYGLHKEFNVEGQKAAYIALGDDYASQRLIQKLESTEFLVVQATYTSQLTAKADVVLPVVNWAEQEGHYLNLEGRLQAAQAVVSAPEGVRTNQAVLEDIAAKLNVSKEVDWAAPLTEYTSIPVAA